MTELSTKARLLELLDAEQQKLAKDPCGNDELAEFIRLSLKRHQSRNDSFMVALLIGFLLISAVVLWLVLKLQIDVGELHQAVADAPIRDVPVIEQATVKRVIPSPMQAAVNQVIPPPAAEEVIILPAVKRPADDTREVIDITDQSLKAKRREFEKLVEQRHDLESRIAAQQAEQARLLEKARREEARILEARQLLDDMKRKQDSPLPQQTGKTAGKVETDVMRQPRKPRVAGNQKAVTAAPLTPDVEKKIRARLNWERYGKTALEAFPED